MQIRKYIYVRMDGWMDGCMDGCMIMDGCMYQMGCIYVCVGRKVGMYVM